MRTPPLGLLTGKTGNFQPSPLPSFLCATFFRSFLVATSVPLDEEEKDLCCSEERRGGRAETLIARGEGRRGKEGGERNFGRKGGRRKEEGSMGKRRKRQKNGGLMIFPCYLCVVLLLPFLRRVSWRVGKESLPCCHGNCHMHQALFGFVYQAALSCGRVPAPRGGGCGG